MSAEAFLVRIRSAPDEVRSREMLELVLAGASLEIDLTVLFEGLAVDHLRPPWAQMWRQLADHDLATLRVQCEPGETSTCDFPVRRLGAEELEDLTRGRRCLDL